MKTFLRICAFLISLSLRTENIYFSETLFGFFFFALKQNLSVLIFNLLQLFCH